MHHRAAFVLINNYPARRNHPRERENAQRGKVPRTTCPYAQVNFNPAMPPTISIDASCIIHRSRVCERAKKNIPVRRELSAIARSISGMSAEVTAMAARAAGPQPCLSLWLALPRCFSSCYFSCQHLADKSNNERMLYDV